MLDKHKGDGQRPNFLIKQNIHTIPKERPECNQLNGISYEIRSYVKSWTLSWL